MSNSLRLMTFNVQCRSFVGEAGGQVNVLPLYNPEERARAISKRILASSHDFDVVALNEVFDEGARGVFAEYLGQRYPHAVLKPGKDISLLVGGVATLLSGNPLFLALGVLASDFTFDDSGVMLFSKFPFAKRAISTATGTQTTEATAFIPYSETAETDSLAAKGALYV